MSQTNNCALKKVVNSPALWPASLQKPLASVTSYVFKSQEHTQKFVKFMKEKLPSVEAKVSRDDKGMYIVNLTNLTRGCKDGQIAGNDDDGCLTLCKINNCTNINNHIQGGGCYCCGGSKCALGPKVCP